MARAAAALCAALAGWGCLGAPPDAVRGDDGGQPDAAARPDGAPAGDASLCLDMAPLAPFVDDFATDELGWAVPPLPNRSGPGAIAMTVTAGELVFAPGAAGGDYAWLQTAPFDFTNQRVAVRVPRVTTDASSQPYLGIIGPGAEEVMFRFDGTRLSSPFGGSAIYVEEVHVWWQVVSDGDSLHFQTSIDGIFWSELDSGSPGFALDAVQFEVGINVDDAGDAERGEFAIDDLDLPPCRA